MEKDVLEMSPSHLYKTGYTIQSKTETPDAGGAVVDTWGSDTSVAGHMRVATQRELDAQQKDEVVATHVFYTDASNAMTNKDRIIDPDGQIFSVKTVRNPHDLDAFLQVMCYRSDFERESDS